MASPVFGLSLQDVPGRGVGEQHVAGILGQIPRRQHIVQHTMPCGGKDADTGKQHNVPQAFYIIVRANVSEPHVEVPIAH